MRSPSDSRSEARASPWQRNCYRGVGPGARRRCSRPPGRSRRLSRIPRAGQGPAAHRRDWPRLANRALRAGLRHRRDPALRHFPAIRATRKNLAGSLARAGRSQVSARNPIQFALVGVQVALAVTLLAGAGLLLRSFQELGRVSPGFDPSRVLTFHISSSWNETADQKASKQRLDRMLDAVRAVPGVEMAATRSLFPACPCNTRSKSSPSRAALKPSPRCLPKPPGHSRIFRDHANPIARRSDVPR